MELRTPRLLLRPWRHEDAERVLDIYGRLEVVRWLGDGEPHVMADLAAAHRAVDRFAERSTAAPLGFWAAEVQASGVVAGTVVLTHLPTPAGSTTPGAAGAGGAAGAWGAAGAGGRDVEIAWHFHPDSWGHGYATEAAGALLENGLAHGLSRIHALTHTDNVRSQGVCRRLAMRHLGREQDWYDVEMDVFVREAPRPGGGSQRVAVPST